MELSRSEQKRRIKELQKVVVELVKLPAARIHELPASQEVKELTLEAGGLKGGARKRMIKYITKLLRQEPVERLYEFLAEKKGSDLQRKKQFHELEYLRDALIEEAIVARKTAREMQIELEENWDSEVVKEVVKELPAVDARGLTRLSFLFAMTRTKKHSREIFRKLQAASEQETINRKMQG